MSSNYNNIIDSYIKTQEYNMCLCFLGGKATTIARQNGRGVVGGCYSSSSSWSPSPTSPLIWKW